MKNLKPITLLLFLFIGLQSFAQSFTDGIFTTTFGNISWTTETGSEYPNGGIVYGDYKDKGTFIGNFDNNGKEVKGTFFNGSAEGKFVFIAPSGKTFNNQNIKTFGGFWGYNSDNIYSQNAADEWNVTAKTGEKNSIKNVTNVWSGKWNTTDGNMILQQVGNKIAGTYKGVGTVTATYNPSNRLLKGTFLNKQTNKSGFLEFYFEGNSFKGKWGWTAAMTGGNWNGDKHVKNNKELSKATTQTTTQPTTSTNNSGTKKYVVTAVSIDASEGKVYGFFGCKLFKVTPSGRQLVQSFGGKTSDFYNITENNENKLLSEKQNFSNSPEFFREFFLNNSDLSNKDVKFELEIYSHMKAKRSGASNLNFGFKKEIFRLDQINTTGTLALSSAVDGTTIFGSGLCQLNFKVTKN
jgi:hypothetical protein